MGVCIPFASVGNDTVIYESCADIRSERTNSPSGKYNIGLRSTGQTLPVMCDMTRFGGGWTRVFHHDYRLKQSLATFKQLDANTRRPEANLYSIMSMLEEFRVDGPYEFMMEWPGSQFTEPQVWRQADLTSDFQEIKAISLPYTAKSFAGLHFSDRFQATFDGSDDTWAYAVMQSREWGGGLYGPGAPVPEAALWVRSVSCHPSCATCLGPDADDCLTCTDSEFTRTAQGTCEHNTDFGKPHCSYPGVPNFM